jgi:DNA modification methylase
MDEMPNKKELIREFENIIEEKCILSENYLNGLDDIISFISTKKIYSKSKRAIYFIGRINYKFRINNEYLKVFYFESSKHDVIYNFHEKKALQEAFDTNNKILMLSILKKKSIPKNIIKSLSKFFICRNERETIDYLHSEFSNPKKLRKHIDNRNINLEICESLFSSFLWSFLPNEDFHKYFNELFHKSKYTNSYWEQLKYFEPKLYNRDKALSIYRFSNKEYSKFDDNILLNNINQIIFNEYNTLNNYGHLIFLFDDLDIKMNYKIWSIIENSILFAEKFIEVNINKSYFKHKEIEKITSEYIKRIDLNKASFNLVNEGFTYKDTYILSNNSYDITKVIIIFQKNKRDETLIPCPACRSQNVHGNSYSSIGVRSWECLNPYCYDKSKYNRGKRYSFKGLLMQEAIDDDRNIISKEYLRQWKRDVSLIVDNNAVLEFIIRCYSIIGDYIHIYNCSNFSNNFIGRNIINKRLNIQNINILNISNLHIIQRYSIDCDYKLSSFSKNIIKNQTLIHGNSHVVLRSLVENTFDGAITSPPYYNAREYSQWSNIYCYLFDMRDIIKQVYRILKPGSYFLFNIFNYFDNENTVVFSDMGQKRMILSSYFMNVFENIGYECCGNIVWDKGEIEGKRGFNSGNFSPFYQSPFNCWEHILIFKKPGINNNYKNEIKSYILKSHPVVKIIKGENKNGHSAPFPTSIPFTLLNELNESSLIIDPFGGSMTTAKASIQANCRSVCIEIDENYYKLGISIINEFQKSLFDL